MEKRTPMPDLDKLERLALKVREVENLPKTRENDPMRFAAWRALYTSLDADVVLALIRRIREQGRVIA